jgi:bacillithiol system protein YtxJ
MARSELETLSKGETAGCWEMVVQQNRELSRLVAEETGIRHESPQIILFRNGKAVWSASHGAVTLDAMRTALGGG